MRVGGDSVGVEHRSALVRHRKVGGAGGDDEHLLGPVGGQRMPHDRVAAATPRGMRVERRRRLVVVDAGEQHRAACPSASSSPTIATHWSGVLPGP